MTTDTKEYIIVKHAQDGIWQHYWDNDPKLGCLAEHSALFTHTGKTCEIELIYTDINQCQNDVKNMNESNPSGAYDVCLRIKE